MLQLRMLCVLGIKQSNIAVTFTAQTVYIIIIIMVSPYNQILDFE